MNVSVIDNFKSVAYVAAAYFITLYQKTFIFLWVHLLTLNHNYLTVFYIVLVLLTTIYLVWCIFIFFLFHQNIFIFWLFLLLIVKYFCILYFIYIYILVHMKINYFDISSNILHRIVIIYKNLSKRISLYEKIGWDNMESVWWHSFIPCFVLVKSTPKLFYFSNITMI